MKEAVEKGRRWGRRYKEGDQMVQGEMIFWILGRAFGRNFLRKNRGRKVMEQRGKKDGGGG